MGREVQSSRQRSSGERRREEWAASYFHRVLNGHGFIRAETGFSRGGTVRIETKTPPENAIK